MSVINSLKPRLIIGGAILAAVPLLLILGLSIRYNSVITEVAHQECSSLGYDTLDQIALGVYNTCAAQAETGVTPALTPRQIEILRLIARGVSTRDIAGGLGLSVKTVDTHRAQIMARLNLHDVPSLVLYAVRQGLISPDD